MRFREVYRDGAAARRCAAAIARSLTRPWTLMEVCGGQTHAIVRHGIDRLLPEGIELVHGPGCPVCVTPVGYVDQAIGLAERPEVILCSFGDMLRVPGSRGDLLAAKSRGADVRMLYSPLDALALARAEPERQVVLFAVGFETTAPATAMAAYRAKREGIANFSLLVAHVRVPPAMRALLEAPDNRIQGFLAAGHVCTVMGYEEYFPIAERYGVPIVITGFEPLDILQGVQRCVAQLERGAAAVDNQYARAVARQGNPAARELMAEVFTVAERRWRGIGAIADSGLKLTPAYADWDAEYRFGTVAEAPEAAGICRSGEVLSGACKPTDCAAFGTRCNPERPLGVTMVSSEGACAAYYRYRGTAAGADR